MPSGGFIQIAIHSHTLGVKLKAVILKQTEEMMCVCENKCQNKKRAGKGVLQTRKLIEIAP